MTSPTTREGRAKLLDSIGGALRLSAPFLAADPGRMPGQLTGRLIGSAEPGVQSFLGEIREHASRPWLCPLTQAIAQAGGPLERVLVGHTDEVRTVAVSPDGAFLASGGHDETVRIWDVVSGRLERTLEGHTSAVNGVVFTPDGARIISGGEDNTVRVWNVASGLLERTLEGHTFWIFDVAVTPDGKRIVSAGDNTIRVWSLATGRLERTIESHAQSIYGVAITPDGERIVSGGEDRSLAHRVRRQHRRSPRPAFAGWCVASAACSAGSRARGRQAVWFPQKVWRSPSMTS